MKSSNTQPVLPSERESLLSQLIKSFTAARDAGNSAEALRLIDRAWRHIPDNPEINFLYGRLRLDDGAFDHAVKLLATAAAGRVYPDYEAAYISALCASGQLELARKTASRVLQSFMVAPDGALAQAARQVVQASSAIPGWVAVGPDLMLHGEIAGPSGTVRLELAGEAFPPRTLRIKCDPGRSYTPFTAGAEAIPPGHVTARVNDAILLGGKLDLPPDFGLNGRARLSKDVISGWVTLNWDPSRLLELTVSGKNGFSMPLETTPDPTHLDRRLFSFTQVACKDAGNVLTIAATMPDGSAKELPISPLLLRAPPAPARPAPAAGTPGRRKIDIVIPVYSGVDDTLACIRSVVATAGALAEIVVINDASPDPDMAARLEAMATAGGITLLHNPVNLGFPATANLGMTLHPDRDVVMLNADTELYGDWLDRLRAAAYGEPRIATVTPLTNSGSIASYPASENPDLPAAEAEALDCLAARINCGVTVDIPTAVGFCMYMRRDAMDEVGVFDDVLFAKGYGEENDFCLRAAKAGWRNLLTADIYVRHAGSKSFGGRRAALLERNLRLLNLRHRGYDASIQAYLKLDPVHYARRRLDEARLADIAGPYVLVVSLALDGGVSRAVDERTAALRKVGFTTLLLAPDPKRPGTCKITPDTPGFDDLRFHIPTELDAFDALLRRLEIDHIELHHFLDHPPEVIEALFALGRPVDIAVHDYVWYCPRITLLNKSGRYCGEPDVGACQACIDKNGGRLKEAIPVAALRERSARWLTTARDVSVPSPSVARRMEAQFPGVTFRVEPLEPDVPVPVRPIAKPRTTDRVKVALIGAIGDHKGYSILLAMARHAAKHDLPLDFVVIGFTRDDQALIATGQVFVTGRYDEDEVPELIRREAPDVILFLSVFPESWCYSLSHALHAHVPVAALELGAIGDRLGGTDAKDMLFPLSLGPAALCDRLLLAFRPPRAKDQNNFKSLSGKNGSSPQSLKPDILANAPALPEAAKSSRTIMAPTSTDPTASVSFLPLTQGLYLFSVRSNHPTSSGGEQVSLPAMQVTPAPGTPAGHIEFMMGGSTVDGWLVGWHNQIVAKVTAPSAVISLLSVLVPGMTPLEIEVQRLDQSRPESQALAAAPAPQVISPLPSTQISFPLDIVAHIQNHGDVTFHEAQWAGMPEEGLWIESIAIAPHGAISSDAIEYKAITATGVETPWVTGGAPCGTRGIGVPITGFALRARPQPGAPQLICEYGAISLSGSTIGPVRNGVPCYSSDSSDPIAAIWVSIGGKAGVPAGTAAPPPQKAGKAAGSRKKTPPPAGIAADSPVKSKKSKIGPRFSVFREPPADHE